MLARIIYIYIKLGRLFFGFFFWLSQVINIKKLGVGLFIRKSWVITVGYA